MSRLAPVLLALLLSCGDQAAEKKDLPARTRATETIVCPINGVPFPKGRGVLVEGKESTFEVCSKGCKYQFELGVDPDPDAGK
jgi:hypothetical protein